MSEIKLPLGLSVAGHAVGLALLILLLPTSIPTVPEPLATGGIEVVLAPLPKPEEPPQQAETPPPVATPPPEPEPPPPDEPVAAVEPPPPVPEVPAPVVEPPPPPAPRKPTVKPPKPVRHQLEQAAPSPTPAPSQPTPAAVAAPQTAYAPTPVPAPVPSTEVSPGYRALLSAWLENHKRYPDSARQRGEEGRAVLRFAVDRSGRVLDFAVAQSSGYPDLDASLEEMMSGALLPPFPASMTQPRIDVSVTIRFSLAR
ncbi:MAG: energy transducer TonB [Alphaproteobacteria bacterium]|nr:energy transducer TonB [Alphaproteobacteria bacterium]